MRLKALKCKTKTEFLYFSVYFFRFQGQNFLTESKGSEIVAYGRQPVMQQWLHESLYASAPCLRLLGHCAKLLHVSLWRNFRFRSWIFCQIVHNV